MTTNDQLENKNQYSTTTTKKNSFDILDPSIVEKLKIQYFHILNFDMNFLFAPHKCNLNYRN